MKNFIKYLSIFIIVLMVSCKEKSLVEDADNFSEALVEANDIERIEPPNWWVGFKNSELQLLVHHEGISKVEGVSVNNAGISVVKIHKADSPNYLFIDLEISKTAGAGKFNLVFTYDDDKELVQTYELKSRKKLAEDYVGFDSSDVLFLITPDRFVNGDASNDTSIGIEGQPDLLEQTVDRTNRQARHGGDIKGITSSLDYISDMGFTAIWPCPLLINDMHKTSYHGYAITDLYKIDPRFGTLEDYTELSQKAKAKGMKLVMDQVANHCGLEHWWMKDLPFKDWVNHQDNYKAHKDNWDWKTTITSNHRRTTNQDLYASKRDLQGNTDGWFVSTMPDLNQRNPFMAKYIIQNSIWWIETAELGGIRQDTYPYPDKDFMSDWAGAIMTEYPNFSIVGEEWSYNPLLIGYWQEGANNRDGYDSNLKSTMDFAMQQNIVDALNDEESWDKGLVKMYEGLANDFHYASPKDIMIFPDNHDMSRIFTQLKGDVVNTKMALSYLLTLPRIPQIYYGTEILMDDFALPGDHGTIRTDFPGGWEGDVVNAFTGEGLSVEQKDMQSYLKTLLNYRKESKAIHDGKTIHFAPFMGTYFLYRITEDEIVIHIINKNEKPIEIDLNYHNETGIVGKTVKNVITGETMVLGDSIMLNERGSLILTTKL